MSHDDLLKGRVSLPGQIYHIIICAEQRQHFFKEFNVARIAVQQMRYINAKAWVDSLAWVVMPDHVHWLIQLNEVKSLAEVIKRFKGRSSRAINDYSKNQGAVWQRGYYDHALRKDEDVQQVARYIAANPLRAGLVTEINDYPHWDAIWL